MRIVHYSCFGRAGSTTFARWSGVLVVLLVGGAAACSDAPADPRTVRGALAAAAQALEARDSGKLFRLIDQRARHAMASIVTSRGDAKRLIEADYPEPERSAALSALGDAALVTSAAELFARRCDEACMAGLALQVGAPTAEERSGDDVVVHTARGQTLHMHAGKDGGFGLVWNTEALSAERDEAARELTQIRDNAETYRRRRALEAPVTGR